MKNTETKHTPGHAIERLANRIFTWLVIEPRRGPEQKAELILIIADSLHLNQFALDALKAMVGLFDGEGNFNEQYQDQVSVALERADIALKANEKNQTPDLLAENTNLREALQACLLALPSKCKPAITARAALALAGGGR